MTEASESSLAKIYKPVIGLDNIVLKVHECLITDPVKINLLCLDFKEDIPKGAELAELLFFELVHYCIPQPTIKRLKEKAANEGKDDIRFYSELAKQARSLFMKYKSENSIVLKEGETKEQFEKRVKNANNRYGEPGELISYCIAIHFLKAAQLVSKMALKTSSEMPVFGLDGIHAVVEDDGSLTVFYLESKMTRDYDSGAKQLASSVSGFEKDRKGRLNEYRILRELSNLDMLEGSEREKAIDYFDPYSSSASDVRERFVGVIAYNEEIYNDKLPIDDSQSLDIHVENFKTQYLNTLSEKLDILTTKLTNSGVTSGKCRTYLLALPNVDELKSNFAKELSGEHIS
ncbi:DUF1837 domain-containing protein [Cronobacter malonaticus]